MKRALITGRGGLDGYYLTELLSAKGANRSTQRIRSPARVSFGIELGPDANATTVAARVAPGSQAQTSLNRTEAIGTQYFRQEHP
ncbi:MAG TPA: hypothetical protein VM184_05965 [Gaiellaceae bacterium]|nr:hypothetical protein [Gaiellaceae bacterium]